VYEPISAASLNEGRVTGTISYRERIAISPNAIVEVKLVDISRADAPSTTIAEQIIKPEGRQVPIQFDLGYDQRRIVSRNRYAVRVRILEGDTPRFITTRAYRVLTGGYGKTVSVILQPVGTQK
jgi:putative lipoprotein